MKISQAKELIKNIVKNTMDTGEQSLVPYTCSIPGLGKSSIVKQVADELGIPMTTVILAQFDAGELGGFPVVNSDGTEYNRAKPFFMPTDQDSVGILFLDELPQAPTANQNVAAQLTLDRCIGEHKLPPKWTIICAGNPLSSKAGTNQMPSHLKDRLMSLEISPDTQAFREYALAQGVSPEITSFINERPEWLSKFDPKADACPSPRSWMKADAVLKMELSDDLNYFALTGTLGEGAVADFQGYMRIWRDLPKFADINAAPDSHPIPENPSVLYALCSSIAHNANDKNVKNIITFIRRYQNKEFAAFCMKDILQRHPELKKNADVGQWIFTDGRELIL